MNFNERGPKRDLGIEDPVRRDEVYERGGVGRWHERGPKGGMRREGEGRRGARTTREDTRKEKGVRRASRNPVYVSRYRNGGKETNKRENKVRKGR